MFLYYLPEGSNIYSKLLVASQSRTPCSIWKVEIIRVQSLEERWLKKKVIKKSAWKMEKQMMDIWLGKQFAVYIITCLTVKMGDHTEIYKHS